MNKEIQNFLNHEKEREIKQLGGRRNGNTLSIVPAGGLDGASPVTNELSLKNKFIQGAIGVALGISIGEGGRYLINRARKNTNQDQKKTIDRISGNK